MGWLRNKKQEDTKDFGSLLNNAPEPPTEMPIPQPATQNNLIPNTDTPFEEKKLLTIAVNARNREAMLEAFDFMAYMLQTFGVDSIEYIALDNCKTQDVEKDM